MPVPDQHLTNTLPTPYQHLTNSYHGSRRKVVDVPQQEFFMEDEEEITESGVYVADMETIEEMADTAGILLDVNNDFTDAQEVYQEIVEPKEQALTVQPKSDPVAAKPQNHKHSIFSSLIRRAEPSKMDGTMLAFNLL